MFSKSHIRFKPQFRKKINIHWKPMCFIWTFKWANKISEIPFLLSISIMVLQISKKLARYLLSEHGFSILISGLDLACGIFFFLVMKHPWANSIKLRDTGKYYIKNGWSFSRNKKCGSILQAPLTVLLILVDFEKNDNMRCNIAFLLIFLK